MAMPAPLGPPLQTAVYPYLDAAKDALQAHARDNGYRIAIESSDKRRTFFRCSKGGKYDNRFKDSTVHPSRQRKNTSTMKTRCKFQAVARKEQGNQWRLEILDNNHNHDAVAALSALLQYRITAMTLEEKAKVKQMRLENYSAGLILISLRNANLDSMPVA
jgi:hypothetical protein